MSEAMNEGRHDDFAEAVQTIRRSRTWAIFDGVTRLWRVGATDSLFVAAVARGRRAFEALPRQERLRAIAVTVAVAAAVHALLLGLVPPPLRSAVPRAFWLVLSVAAAGAAVRRSGARGQASDA
jgi:hypothetical protein